MAETGEPVLSCVICHRERKPCRDAPERCMTAVEHAHHFGYPAGSAAVPMTDTAAAGSRPRCALCPATAMWTWRYDRLSGRVCSAHRGRSGRERRL